MAENCGLTAIARVVVIGRTQYVIPLDRFLLGEHCCSLIVNCFEENKGLGQSPSILGIENHTYEFAIIRLTAGRSWDNLCLCNR
jgi:hypothetical protein